MINANARSMTNTSSLGSPFRLLVRADLTLGEEILYMLFSESRHYLSAPLVHVDIADLSPPDHASEQRFTELQSRRYLLNSEQRFISES